MTAQTGLMANSSYSMKVAGLYCDQRRQSHRRRSSQADAELDIEFNATRQPPKRLLHSGQPESYFSNAAAVNTALFFKCVQTVANSASILNDEPAVRKYRALGDSITFAYNAAFFHPEQNTYGNGSQTEDILPLAVNG